MLSLVGVNTSASFSSFPFLFLLSFSLFPSLLPSSFNRLCAYLSIDSPRKKMTPSCHRVFICSPNLERICIRANRLLLVRDHPTLHIVLEAAISVSFFTLLARHVRARFKFPGTLHPLQLLGDVKSQYYMGCLKTQQKSTDLEKVINSNNLCIWNNKSPTNLNPSTGSYSAIDITLSDPLSYMDYTWKVHHDPCGRDHFPIILEITLPIYVNDRPPSWKTNTADWQQFKILCNKRLVQDPNTSSNKAFYWNINRNSKWNYTKNLTLKQTQHTLV